MATYVNDLRLKEIATGDESGTWGTSTNTNLELIAEAFSYGTEASFSSDADATTTIADGATDPARSLYLKVTSGVSLTATRTLTIAPNTVSKVWIIENATSGSQSINISQGSGANVTIPNGDVKVIYTDGAGSGAAVVDAFTDLNTSGTLTATNLAGTLTTAAQTNITSVGTLSSLTVSGDATFDTSTLKVDATNNRVGIGTTSPSNALDVQTSAGKFSVEALGGGSVRLASNGSMGMNVAAGFSYEIDVGGSEVMRIDSSGNVGIGGTSPGSYGKFVLFQNSNTNGGGISVIDSGLARTGRLWTDGNRVYLSSGATGTGDLVLNEGGGNVGIGTTSPDTLTHIAGAAGSAVLRLENTDSFLSDGEIVGKIEFETQDSGGAGVNAYIQGVGVSTNGATRLDFGTGGSNSPQTRMTINSNGNVGIGTASPSRELDIQASSGWAELALRGASGSAGSLEYYNASTKLAEIFANTSTDIVFRNSTDGTTERMRIDSSGNLLVGKTSDSNTANGVTARPDGGARFTSAGTSSFVQLAFFRNGSPSEVGSITTTSSATAYNTSSDYRLKENVVEMSGALDRVNQLQPKRFNFIADADTTVDGFLAHEVQDIVPEAITGEKDAVDDEGNAIYQGIDQSKLVPLLTKAIQEQQTIIDDLKTRIEALEA